LISFDLFVSKQENIHSRGLKSNAVLQWIVLPVAIIVYIVFQARTRTCISFYNVTSLYQSIMHAILTLT
jgi:hypothetical protein